MPKSTEIKYVAFCDVLGFSKQVLTDFEKTKSVYQEFHQELQKDSFPKDASISIYSDSIFIEADELKDILWATQLLYSVCLRHKWLIRGGIAKGKHWRESDKNNLFLVSEALTKAVAIEKTIKRPVIAISEDITLGIEYWVSRFAHDVFVNPVLYFDNIIFVNPFNRYWFASAEIHLKELLERHPDNRDKYNWLLELIDSMKRDDLLVPIDSINEMMDKGILTKHPDNLKNHKVSLSLSTGFDGCWTTRRLGFWQ